MFKLADNPEAAYSVASVIADNFDKLPENVRNELLLKLADNPKVAHVVWSDKEDNAGIRIYNEIKNTLKVGFSYLLIDYWKLAKEKNLRDQLSSNRKVSNNLVEEMCRFSGVYDINVKEKDGKSTSYISESKDISVTLANLGSGFQQK